ncbi:hypothetical protein ACUIJQ_03360 [Levilactobacillus hammesii]|uniref:Uncharacterized protein n=1 Tax=Levilactobacillus hammesii DSM 16381 TaxID=1423753 RepID=A0A0R1URL5_9LACO|nr:hypothetical protein [Levilactobacillus hammesii]KRL94083.1 hypothetical protein FD28_GL000630 [Levilactobacillus hammesii DSM 16381]
MGKKLLDILKQLFLGLNLRFWVTRYAIAIGAAVAWIYFCKSGSLGGHIPFFLLFLGIQAAIFYPIANGFLVMYEWEHGRKAKGIFDNLSEMQAADFRKAQFRAVRLVNTGFNGDERSFGEMKSSVKSDAAGMKMMVKVMGHVILWCFALFFAIVGAARYLLTLGPEGYTFNYREDGTFIGDSDTEDQKF